MLGHSSCNIHLARKVGPTKSSAEDQRRQRRSTHTFGEDEAEWPDHGNHSSGARPKACGTVLPPDAVHAPGVAHVLADRLSRVHWPGGPGRASADLHPAIADATEASVPERSKRGTKPTPDLPLTIQQGRISGSPGSDTTEAATKLLSRRNETYAK